MGVPLFFIPDTETTEQLALFGEISYQLTDQLTATLGARNFDYDRDTALGFNGPVAPAIESSESGTTYKANLSYQPNDDLLVYGQWAEGFRLGYPLSSAGAALCDADSDGLVDGLGISRPTQVESDTSESFELGIKASFADSRVTVNAAVYHIEWDNIPVALAPTPACNIPLNVGQAESEGVELEVQLALTESLQVSASASYGESVFSEDAGIVGSKGDNLPGSADFNMNLGMEYQFSIADRASFVRADYHYLSDYYHNVAEQGQASGGFGQLNLKVGTTIDKFDVEVFVNNLNNANEYTWVEAIVSAQIGTSSAYQLRPRTAGLNVNYHF
jgi:outer membrane receptor protein involved in Fe transport